MKTAKTKDQDITYKQDLPKSITQEHDEQASSPDVAEIAYFKAEKRGFVPGYELSDWLESERELNISKDNTTL